MLLLSYDISDDKLRTSFSKFLDKYGRRFQYSVYQIRNSPRVLNNIVAEIEKVYGKQFGGADSVVIFTICDGCKNKIKRFGFAKNEELDVVVFS
jgi:CRISPR-associated protein Cas2